MKKLINTFYDVREGEWAATGLMFLLHFVLMVTLYFLKPARDSLFLTEIGPQQLPLVYILLAVVAIPVTQVLSKLTQSYPIQRVIQGSLAFLLLNLLAIRWLLSIDAGWIYMVFYIWVGIFGILIISQFWLFANGLFDAAQSKRLFALLNLGAILGAIFGSQVSSVLVSYDVLNTSNLIYICIALLVVCMALVYKISADGSPDEDFTKQSEADQSQSISEVFKAVYKSKYQLLIAGIIGMTMLATTLVDYQFKAIATDYYPDTAVLTSFMGTFYAGLSMASLAIQVLFSTQIIKRMGLGGAVLTRPAGMLIGAILLAIEPVLASAIFIRGFDGATRYSIDKTGRELLFLPLPQQIKKKTKVFIDIFVDRFFRGIAGLLLLLFIYVQGLSIQQITYVVIAVIGCWVVLGFWAKRAYVNRFRTSLQKRFIDSENIAFDLNEASVVNSIKEMLQSEDDYRIIYALSLLEETDNEPIAEELAELLHHDHLRIRLKALQLLQKIDSLDLTEKVKSLLKDESPEIRLEAIYYMCQHSGEDPDKVMQSYLENENAELQSAAIGCVGKHGGDTGIVDDAFFEKMLAADGNDGVVVRAQMAQAIGFMGDKTKAVNYLAKLLEDEEDLVIREALESVSRLKDDRLIPHLMQKLKESDYVIEARKALASYGKDHLLLYKQKFMDTSLEREMRRRIPGIFALVPEQKSIDLLIEMLEETDPALRYHVIKALNKLRKNYGRNFSFDEKSVRHYLRNEAFNYFELLSIKMVQRRDIPNNILLKSLDEKMDQTVERLFRLSGLCYNPQDMYGAYLALRSNNKENRAAAIEFIDNVLDQEDKTYIFPIVDNIDADTKLREGKKLFDLPVETYEQGMLYMLDGNDLWLKACALFSVSTTCPDTLQSRVQEAAQKADSPLLTETAEYVLERNNYRKHENNY